MLLLIVIDLEFELNFQFGQMDKFCLWPFNPFSSLSTNLARKKRNLSQAAHSEGAHFALKKYGFKPFGIEIC